MSKSAYEASGVSIDAGQEAVDLIKTSVKKTLTPRVLAGVGAFGGLFDLGDLPEQPVMVASTDGVGTKVKIAANAGRYKGVGMDIVNHCINDLACAGAGMQPLFFLDYVAASALEPAMVAEVVSGMAEACEAAGCAILGGETAEMPGVYAEGSFDIVGTMTGVLSKPRLYPDAGMAVGDVLVGLPSSGPHTNGYSLIRHVFGEEIEGETLDALLAPHRSYLPELRAWDEAGVSVRGLAHITGGGITENLPRALTEGLTARVDTSAWEVPAIFRQIEEKGGIAREEMLRVFNMGVGLIAVVPAAEVDAALTACPEAFVVGEVVAGDTLTYV